MLLAVTIFPLVCALILFAYFFGRFAGEQDTAKLADAMRQMNYARIIPFPGIKRRGLKGPESLLESDIVGAAALGEVLVFTGCKSKSQIGQRLAGLLREMPPNCCPRPGLCGCARWAQFVRSVRR